MKFCYFHLMPYAHLPDDFEKRYHSVWVDIPNHLYDPLKGHQLYNTYLDELEYADKLGFDGICVNEHHYNAYGGMPSPNLMAAAMAQRTSQSAIVVLGNSLGLYNPPVRVAEEFAMLDVLSGGRLVAGMPLGSAADAIFSYGEVPVIMQEKYQESHDLIIKAWTEREPFSFNGKYNQLRYVNIWPRPLQQPYPPRVGSRERKPRDLGLDYPAQLRLQLPELSGLSSGQAGDGWLLEGIGKGREGV